MGKLSILILTLMILNSGVIPADAAADTFDWRDFDGGNYLTSVKNQGSAGTCWAFAAVGALEAKFDITYKNPFLNLDLSEQHLVCDGTSGDINGGWEYKALNFFQNTGIVSEAELPYTASNYSSNWPLKEGWENRTYKVTAVQNWLTCTEENIKSSLQTQGPLVSAMRANEDWYWPSSTTPLSTNIPSYYSEAMDEKTDEINHAVLIVGYKDIPSFLGDSYWIVKNSWGEGWGDNGYGYIQYDTLLEHGRIHAITGEAYYAPEPISCLLFLVGAGPLAFFGYKKKKDKNKC